MKSKKNYASPEIDIISFSFENILAATDDYGDDPDYIKHSKSDNLASDGAEAGW